MGKIRSYREYVHGLRVECPYCSGPAQFLHTSESIYNGRDYGPLYVCWKCEAWVGCHSDTNKPLGRLANKELRLMKQAAHKALDPLWRGTDWPRSAVYAWLAQAMSLELDQCHISMFDVGQCEQAIALCEAKQVAITIVSANIVSEPPAWLFGWPVPDERDEPIDVTREPKDPVASPE